MLKTELISNSMEPVYKTTMKTIIFSFFILLSVSIYAQQTSTDTTWRVKAREKGQKDIPPYPKSLTVAQDGTGDYKTIQEAVNAVRDLSQERVNIYIKP